MPTFEVKVPVGANQIWMKTTIREAVAEATRRGKLRPNSVDSITGENSGDNLGPGTPIVHFEQWERDDIEVKLHPQGRRLREHQRAVRAAGGAAAPRPRRPLARGRAQVHPARRVAGPGQGLQPGRGGRVHRRRPHLGLPARQGAAVPHARRREPRRAARGARGAGDVHRQHAGRRADGLRRQRVAHRLQDRACSTACPPASSSRWPTTAGRSAGWASCSTPATGHITSWLYRDRGAADPADVRARARRASSGAARSWC